MSKRDLISTGLLAFGAGIAFGSRWPRSSRFAAAIMEKLGFDFAELALDIWDPEASAPAPKKRKPSKKAKAVRSTKPRRRVSTVDIMAN